MRAVLANLAWYASSLPSRSRFLRDAARAEAVQAHLLRRLLSANAETQFGRAHGFSDIRDLPAYRRRVPIRSYEEFAPWIDAVAEGRPRVLTEEPVLRFQPTGGSTGGAKLVPYTRSLQREFRRAIATWVADIFGAIPSALQGTSYWSISPPGRAPRTTASGIPIGHADDVEYLGGQAPWVRPAMAAPRRLARIPDPDRFMAATGLALLRRADLSILSVWNPTFALVLFDRIRRELPDLLRVIHDGGPGPDFGGAARPDPGRARAIERAFHDPHGAFERTWPRLGLVSCWMDAAARPAAERLRLELPGVRMQGKGLLATEGFVTIPLFGAGGPVPAYRSHVLEFVDDAGTSGGIGELTPGREYAVVLSTGGGLYRYALGDRVRVTGCHAGLPLVEFLGRPQASDVVGEKLDAGHVQLVVAGALASVGLAPRFVLVAPETDARAAGYVLFIEFGPRRVAGERLARLGEAVERGFCTNPQYAHARELGQLRPLRVLGVRDAPETFLRRCGAEGQALGDVKPTVLDRRTGWTGWFEGDILVAGSTPEESTTSPAGNRTKEAS